MPDSKASHELLALGWAMTSEGLVLGLSFLLPTLGGHYLDQRWKSTPWATFTGAALGFAFGMMRIVRIAKKSAPADAPKKTTETSLDDPPSPAIDRPDDRDAS